MLRIQSKTGRFVVDSLHLDSTFWSLQQVLEGKTGINPHAQKGESDEYSLCVHVCMYMYVLHVRTYMYMHER